MSQSAPGSTITVGGEAHDLAPGAKVSLLALGKAAIPMATQAIEILGSLRGATLIIAKEKGDSDELEVQLGNHPDPRTESGKAGELLLRFADGLPPGGHLLCLLSGGGSSLAATPKDGITVNDLNTVGRSLRNAGATIERTNDVRSRLERLKGGGLLEMAHKKGVHVSTIAISDVPGDIPHLIASGPTHPRNPEASEPVDVLSKLEIDDKEVEGIVHRGGPVPAQSSVTAGDFTFVIGASNKDAIAAFQEKLPRDIQSEVFADDLEGDAEEIGDLLGRYAAWVAGGQERKMKPKMLPLSFRSLPENLSPPFVLVAGGELTVKKRGSVTGIGGRSYVTALSAAPRLKGTSGITLICLATDGDDGNSQCGGAVVTSRSAEGITTDKVESYLRQNNSYKFFEERQDALRFGPTGTNVNDLFLIIIEDPSI